MMQVQGFLGIESVTVWVTELRQSHSDLVELILEMSVC